MQGLGPKTQAAVEEEVDVGLRRLTHVFRGIGSGAQRRESQGQAQAANKGQRKEPKHVAEGLSSGVEGVPYTR